MAQEYFELANVLDGSMTPEEAREYYKKSIGDLYGVSVKTYLIEELYTGWMSIRSYTGLVTKQSP